MYKIIVLFFAMTAPLGALGEHSQVHKPYVSCRDDNVKYRLRSEEMRQILKADQDDRTEWGLNEGAQFRDRQRRMRVGAIFGEGCFKEAGDYIAAALVFQHGDQPEQFFQTFIWAKRAVELGDSSHQDLVALGVDRYLVNTGRKQLFGSQYFKSSTKAEGCWCLYQTEASFPDQLRVKYTKMSYQQSLERLKTLNAGRNCPIAECSENLEDSPVGSVPGLW